MRLGVTIGLVLAFLVTVTAEARAQKRKPTVAILYFDYDGTDEEMGHLRKGLAQMLITDVSVVQGIELVERTRLEDVLKELKLNQTNKIDKRSANKIGKLLGAKYLIVGGYWPLMGSLRIDVRMLSVERGTVVKSIGYNRKVTEFFQLEQQIAADLIKFLKTEVAVGSQPAAPQKKPGAKKPRTKRKRAKKPKRLIAKTASRYGRALDAIDRGDKKEAKKQLKKVLKEQPDFELASLDLASLAK